MEFNCNYSTLYLQYLYIIWSINADLKQSTKWAPCVRKIGNVYIYTDHSDKIGIILPFN